MEFREEITLISVLLLYITGKSHGFGSGNDRILLNDLQVLTLRHGQSTTARRSSPIPQLKCVGGSAGCSFTPQVVQCYNRGSDGYDVQWECKTDMDNAYRFGQVEVSCEGYDYPDDPYVLRGSCGLEYTLDYTKEGQQQKDRSHNYYGSQDSHHHHDSGYNNYNSYSKPYKKSSWLGDMIPLAIFGIIIYAIYKTCLSNNDHTGRASGGASDSWRGHDSRGQPPPPGFRPDYMPGSGCSSTYDSTYQDPGYGFGTNYGYQRRRGYNPFGGFWGGAATGGLLGYMFGSRNNTQYQQHYQQPNNHGWGNTGNSWFGSSNTGTSGTSFFRGGSSSGSSGSTGTRTASGFGGTRRR